MRSVSVTVLKGILYNVVTGFSGELLIQAYHWNETAQK
jgi:hypothetical protein